MKRLFTINTKNLSQGLRASKRLPRNAGGLVECTGAVGRDGVLQSIDELTALSILSSKVVGSDSLIYTCTENHTADITNKPITGINYTEYWSQAGAAGTVWVEDTAYAKGIVGSFPYPQIFVFINMIIICDETDIYEYLNGVLTHKLAVTAGETWTAVDFYDYIYMSNQIVSVTRDSISHEYSVSTLPGASTICNFNGQVLIGNPNFSSVSSSVGSGYLYGTGTNGDGELGLNDVVNRDEFEQAGVYEWEAISNNYRFSMAIKSDNTLHGTGLNDKGQLGLNDTTDRDEFTQAGTATWDMISCGGYSAGFSMAIKSDGTLHGTGWNGYGQLGLNDIVDRDEFTQAGTALWEVVSCSADYASLAIKSDNTLWCSGRGRYGELGLGATGEVHQFTQIGSDTWQVVSCGGYHTMAIKSDGTLHGTGWNTSGQLGLNDLVNRNTLTQVGSATWQAVSCGLYHTIAIKTDGTLWSTGSNGSGQLGLNDTVDRDEFTQVGTDTWQKVSCGFDYSMAIKINGILYGTGGNSSGQLGLNDTTNRDEFTQVGSATWQAVSCGNSAYHTLAIKT